MKRKSLNENQIRNILAVYGELLKLPYDELNKHLGSVTIKEMLELQKDLNDWYHGKVLDQRYDEELGWMDPYKEAIF